MSAPIPAPDPRRVRRDRAKLIALGALTLAPLLLASALYYLAPNAIPGARTNHGALLQPPAQLHALGITAADGRTVAAGEARLWRVVVFARDGCGATCSERLERLRSLHALLGADRDRVRRVLALGPGTPRPALAGHDDGLVVARAPAGMLRDLSAGRDLVGGDHAEGEPPVERGVLLADPLGNVILLYRMEQIGEPLLEDLERLLRLSNIG